MEALKSLVAQQARVRRMGEVLFLPAYQLVPSDIVLLEAGNIVPADLRIIESYQLGIDESTLTGESQTVNKVSDPLPPSDPLSKIPITEQFNMAFKGTIVTSGRAEGIVINTGMKTELGKIAKLLESEVEVKTPLQKKIAEFAKKLSIIVVALCVIIFFVGLARGENPILMFMTALSLAVAAIPEALPAVITMSLALGARVLSRRNSLIRKLPAVEALGSITYICSDKTGTLTQNKMTIQEFYINNKFYLDAPENWKEFKSWDILVKTLALNNDVVVRQESLLGDPTEVALVQWASHLNQDKLTLEDQFPRVAELPFSSQRSMMSTLHRSSSGGFLISKGAPEKIIPLCHQHYGSSGLEPFDSQSLTPAINSLTERGFRVLALAHRDFDIDPLTLELDLLEKNLNFIGLIGLIDPPRTEVKAAIELCKTAGIHVVMITGDHPLTAQAIATQLGIIQPQEENVLSGKELSLMSDDDFAKVVKAISVYARMVPEQKIRIVKALQDSGEIVAMTGDGVNDAPALRSADIGIAMGKSGTDVAREASHIILLDDNFASIVSAVQEGRRIFDNIRKFIRFALAGNSGEIWTLFLAPLMGLPTPLLPIHILWVNLVTDGLPGLALAFEKEEHDIMHRPPHPPSKSIFNRDLLVFTLWVGLLTAAVSLGVMAWAYLTHHAHWQSMVFTVLTFSQMGLVFSVRSVKESVFHLNTKSNLPLLGTIILTTALQLATLYIPSLNQVFKTQPLTIIELTICIGASSLVFFAVELEKYFQRHNRRNNFRDDNKI